MKQEFDFFGNSPRRKGKNAEGLGLLKMMKSKEFKQRVELLKKGGQIGSRLAIKGSRLAFARGKSLYDNWKLKRRE